MRTLHSMSNGAERQLVVTLTVKPEERCYAKASHLPPPSGPKKCYAQHNLWTTRDAALQNNDSWYLQSSASSVSIVLSASDRPPAPTPWPCLEHGWTHTKKTMNETNEQNDPHKPPYRTTAFSEGKRKTVLATAISPKSNIRKICEEHLVVSRNAGRKLKTFPTLGGIIMCFASTYSKSKTSAPQTFLESFRSLKCPPGCYFFLFGEPKLRKTTP